MSGSRRVSPGGSSPLARGTLHAGDSRAGSGRLIPARAGNTEPGAGGRGCKAAHPRSRGEHSTVGSTISGLGGSSPLARGTLVNDAVSLSAVRLIPARAGNTYGKQWGANEASAHPRSRGEHRHFPSHRVIECGSSPLARGTRTQQLDKGIGHRLIPARAGNTLADMGFYPLHQQNRITLEPEPASRIHDKQ